jgi:hypothetical protein
MTLEQVGQIIGVTKERVRQIQNKAMEKIRLQLEAHFLGNKDALAAVEAAAEALANAGQDGQPAAMASSAGSQPIGQVAQIRGLERAIFN